MKQAAIILSLVLLLIACGSGQDQESGTEATSSDTEVIESEAYTEEEEESAGIEDGTHTATVYYNNSETGHSATYTLDVEVEGNEVTTIYFESGGYLDSDHIQSGELDESGSTTIYGEGGKTYDVQID
jgi:hypothetical protein